MSWFIKLFIKLLVTLVHIHLATFTHNNVHKQFTNHYKFLMKVHKFGGIFCKAATIIISTYMYVTLMYVCLCIYACVYVCV